MCQHAGAPKQTPLPRAHASMACGSRSRAITAASGGLPLSVPPSPCAAGRTQEFPFALSRVRRGSPRARTPKRPPFAAPRPSAAAAPRPLRPRTGCWCPRPCERAHACACAAQPRRECRPAHQTAGARHWRPPGGAARQAVHARKRHDALQQLPAPNCAPLLPPCAPSPGRPDWVAQLQSGDVQPTHPLLGPQRPAVRRQQGTAPHLSCGRAPASQPGTCRHVHAVAALPLMNACARVAQGRRSRKGAAHCGGGAARAHPQQPARAAGAPAPPLGCAAGQAV